MQQQQVDQNDEEQELLGNVFLNRETISRKFDESKFNDITYISLKSTTRSVKDYFIHLYTVVRLAQTFLHLCRDRIDNTETRYNFPAYAEFTTFSVVHRERKLFNHRHSSNGSFFKHSISPFLYRNLNDFFVLYSHYKNSLASYSDGIRKITRRLKELDYTLCGIRYFFRYIWALKRIVTDISLQSPDFRPVCRDWIFAYVDREFVTAIEDVSLYLQGKMTQNCMEHIPYPFITPALFLHQCPPESHKFYFEDHESNPEPHMCPGLTDLDGNQLFTVFQVHKIHQDGKYITKKLPANFFAANASASNDSD